MCLATGPTSAISAYQIDAMISSTEPVCHIGSYFPLVLTSPGTNTTGLCPPGYDYTQSLTAKRYQTMRDALLAQNRTIQYALCEGGAGNVHVWGNATGSSWRISGDILASWASVLDLLNQNSFLLHNVDFWGRADPDMLEVGNGLSPAETRSHFAFWAAMKAPLLIGTNLATLDAESVKVLKNKYLLAFSQDEYVGKPAMPYKWGTNPDWTFNATFPAEYWSGASSEGTLVLLLNPYEGPVTKKVVFAEVPQLEDGVRYRVANIWTGEDLGCVEEEIEAVVEAHDTAGFLVGGECNGLLGAGYPEQDLL